MRFIKNFLIFFFSISLYGYSQNWDWTQTIGVKYGFWGGHNYCYGVCTDKSGNVISTGRVKGYARFGKDSLTFTGTPPACIDASSDVFLVKYSPDGNLIWARQEPNCGIGWARAVTSDRWNNIYITGEYTDTAIFGPFILSANGDSLIRNIFIVKYDSMGNCLWAKSAGGPEGHSLGHAITADDNGNVFVGGEIMGLVEFDTVTIGTSGIQQAVFAKYNTKGNLVWVKNFYSYYYGSSCYGLWYSNGKVYITGNFKWGIYFDGHGFTASNTSSNDMFMVKYDTAGNYQWANIAIGPLDGRGIAITTDTSGNIIVAGRYNGSLDFVDTSIVASPTNPFSYIVKYDSSGTLQWVRSLPGKNVISVTGIVADYNNNIFLGGILSDSVIFDTFIVYAPALVCFISKLTEVGNYSWTKTVENVTGTYVNAMSLAADSYGNLFIGGFFNDTLIFDQDTITADWEPSSAFAVKLMQPVEAAVSVANNVCQFDSLLFSGESPGSPLSYQWSFNGSNLASSTLQNVWVTFNTPGNYQYSHIVSSQYSSDTLIDSITVYPKTFPLVNIGSDSTVCAGFILNAGAGFIKYIWSDNSLNQYLAVVTSGEYAVEVTDTNYCKNSDSVYLIVNPLPVVNLGPDTFACPNYSIVLYAGSGFTSYLWNDGSTNDTLAIDSQGTYFVNVTDNNSCSNSDTVSVDLCNDIPELKKSVMMFLSPNPAHDFIDIAYDADMNYFKNTKIMIVNSKGQILHIKSVDNGLSFYRFDISDLYQGIYSLIFSDDTGYYRSFIFLKS